MTDNKERTFIMIKPDGVQRGLVGKIIQRFEDKGFKLVAMKMVWVSIFFFFFTNEWLVCLTKYFFMNAHNVSLF